MAITAFIFSNFAQKAGTSEFAALSGNANIKVTLHPTAPSQELDVYMADLPAELADPSYTAGGQALTGFLVTQTNKVVKLDADDITFSNLSGTFRYVVLRDATSGVAATEPLIAYLDLGANVTPAAQDYKITWHASGITTHTAA